MDLASAYEWVPVVRPQSHGEDEAGHAKEDGGVVGAVGHLCTLFGVINTKIDMHRIWQLNIYLRLVRADA